jgi:hypothetical protein
MKLVMTLVVRDESDVVDMQIAYHLNAGVDLVIAAIGEASQETAELLAPYERDGSVRLLTEPGQGDAADPRTRMARLAATQFEADWVINAEPAEFWWPRGESLDDVLAPIPPRYTIVQGLRRLFVAQPGEDEDFSERMTLRHPVRNGSGAAPALALRPVHRADPSAVVHPDGTVTLGRQVPLRAWYPLEVFQFPDRVRETVEPADSLVQDTRLRDALRSLRDTGGVSFRTPDVVDDAAYAVECAAVGEVDLPRLEQYVSELEQRVGWLEQRLWPRFLRSAARLVGRGR